MENGSPRDSEPPCTAAQPAFPTFRHFYHSDVFKTYADSVLNQDLYADQKSRLCELYKQNVVVLKPGRARVSIPEEKETPVLKFSVNAILGTDNAADKSPPLPGKYKT